MAFQADAPVLRMADTERLVLPLKVTAPLMPVEVVRLVRSTEQPGTNPLPVRFKNNG